MNPELLHRLAREAGMRQELFRQGQKTVLMPDDWRATPNELARFAALVAEHIAQRLDEQSAQVYDGPCGNDVDRADANAEKRTLSEAASLARAAFPMPKD